MTDPFGLLTGVPGGGVFRTAFAPGKDWQAWTPKFGIDYSVSDDVLLYASVTRGFKSGGFMGEAGNAVEAVTPYDPEQQSTWEVGAKMSTEDGQLQLNTAAFHNEIDDMHVNQFTGLPGVSVVRNAGQATTQGVEIEGIWLPTDALRLQLSYGYLDAEWDEFMEAPAIGQPISNVADNRSFPHAPEHTLNLMADARLAQTAWGELRALADYSYSSSFYAYAYQLDTIDTRRATARNTKVCLLYTSDAADDLLCVDLGGRRTIKKTNT